MAGAVLGACERRTPETRRRGEDEGSERMRSDERDPGQSRAACKSLCMLSRLSLRVWLGEATRCELPETNRESDETLALSPQTLPSCQRLSVQLERH